MVHHRGAKAGLRRQRLNLHQGQRCDHREVAKAIDQKAIAFSEAGYHQASQRRAHQPRHVDHGRVKSNGVAEVLPVLNHLHHKGLAPRHIEGVNQALKCAEGEDFPNRHQLRERQCSQQKRLHGSQSLGPEQHISAVEPVDPHPGEGGHDESRDLPYETDHTQQKRRTGEPVDEPAGGYPRHPGADEGDTLSAEK